MNKATKLTVAAMTSLMITPVWAAPFSATIPDHGGPIYSVGSAISYFFGNVTSPGDSAPGGATMTFDLVGYGGIDGYGPRISNLDVFDQFSFRAFTSPGNEYFEAYLNMGGAHPGNPIVWNNGQPVPFVDLISYTDNGPGKGGLAQFSVDFTLLTGDNSFVFQFGCCSNGTEEGWGVRNIRVTADIPTGQPPGHVPEPATGALAALGLLGLVAGKRRQSGNANAD